MDKQTGQEMPGRQTPCILMASQSRDSCREEKEAAWGLLLEDGGQELMKDPRRSSSFRNAKYKSSQ